MRLATLTARLLLYVAGTLFVVSLTLCALAIYLATLPARRLSTSSARRAAKLEAGRQIMLAIGTFVALSRATDQAE